MKRHKREAKARAKAEKAEKKASKKAAREAKPKRQKRQPLTADEARAAARAEGLELVPSIKNESGFKYVYKIKNRFQVKVKCIGGGRSECCGCFATAEEAALCYARHIGAERAAAEAARARVGGPQPLDLPLNQFVRSDAGHSVLPPLAVQRNYVASMQTSCFDRTPKLLCST